MPLKSKLQLYSKYQKSRKLLESKYKFKCESKLKNKVSKFNYQLSSKLKDHLNKRNHEEDENIIKFTCSENNEILPIDADFLKLIIQLNTIDDKSAIVLTLDENLFESVFSIISMDKFYKTSEK